MTRLAVYSTVAAVLGILLLSSPGRVQRRLSNIVDVNLLALRLIGLGLLVISGLLLWTVLGQVAP